MPDTETKPHYGMLIDLARCVGCNACAVACKMEHETPEGCYNTWVESWDAGVYPDVLRANVPKQCNHCADAPCQAVCPTGATYTTDEGVVLVDEEACVGCGACLDACPYGARWIDADAGKAGKCTFCYERATAGLTPRCVGTCITKARLFGDLNDPDSDISRRLAEVEPERLRADLGGDVAVFYVGLAKTTEAPAASEVWRGGNLMTR